MATTIPFEPQLVNPNPHGINVAALIAEFNTSQQYVEAFSKDFPQLDNLVDGIPVTKEDGAPFVGDTTMAGLVRSIPRASLKQVPTFAAQINGSKLSVDAHIANFLLRKKVFNEDTFGKGLLSTLQIGAEQALTHGYAPFMSVSGKMYDDYGTMLRLLHYSDTSLEPGVSDSNESGYHFVVAHLTPSRIRKILKAAENNPETSWNVEGLRRVLESTPIPKDYTQYQPDSKKMHGADAYGKTYEFITLLETGSGAKKITFCKEYQDAPLRVLESKSKWGYPPVQYLVIDPAALTPFGTSRVRLASPNQNFMNIYYGNIATMLLLNSNPPVFKRGVFLKPTPLKKGALWESVDPNAEITLKTLDNGALAQFPTMAQQFAGQIQNIMGGQTNTVSAGSKNSMFGRTAPGVQAGQEFMSLEANQITNILENFLRQFALSALDILISERSGEEILILDDEAMNAINQVAPGAVGEDHKIQIIWEEFYARIEEMAVFIEGSLSPDELKERKHADLQDMLVVLAQNAQTIPGAAEKVQEITNMLLQDKSPLVKPMPIQAPQLQPGPDMSGMPQPEPPMPSM